MTFTHRPPFGIAHELFVTFFRRSGHYMARSAVFHPPNSTPQFVFRFSPFPVPRGGRTLFFNEKLTPPHLINLEQSSIQRPDWTTDPIGRLIHEIDSVQKGYRTCGGMCGGCGPAEAWLMGLVWLEAVTAAVLLVLNRIGLIDCRRSTVRYRGNRPK